MFCFSFKKLRQGILCTCSDAVMLVKCTSSAARVAIFRSALTFFYCIGCTHAFGPRIWRESTPTVALFMDRTMTATLFRAEHRASPYLGGAGPYSALFRQALDMPSAVPTPESPMAHVPPLFYERGIWHPDPYVYVEKTELYYSSGMSLVPLKRS